MSRQDHKQQVASNLCKLSNCYITLAGRLKFKLNFQQRSEISALLGHLWFELNIRATKIIPLPSNSFVAMVTPPFLYLIEKVCLPKYLIVINCSFAHCQQYLEWR